MNNKMQGINEVKDAVGKCVKAISECIRGASQGVSDGVLSVRGVCG